MSEMIIRKYQRLTFSLIIIRGFFSSANNLYPGHHSYYFQSSGMFDWCWAAWTLLLSAPRSSYCLGGTWDLDIQSGAETNSAGFWAPAPAVWNSVVSTHDMIHLLYSPFWLVTVSIRTPPVLEETRPVDQACGEQHLGREELLLTEITVEYGEED